MKIALLRGFLRHTFYPYPQQMSFCCVVYPSHDHRLPVPKARRRQKGNYKHVLVRKQ